MVFMVIFIIIDLNLNDGLLVKDKTGIEWLPIFIHQVINAPNRKRVPIKKYVLKGGYQDAGKSN